MSTFADIRRHVHARGHGTSRALSRAVPSTSGPLFPWLIIIHTLADRTARVSNRRGTQRPEQIARWSNCSGPADRFAAQIGNRISNLRPRISRMKNARPRSIGMLAPHQRGVGARMSTPVRLGTPAQKPSGCANTHK